MFISSINSDVSDHQTSDRYSVEVVGEMTLSVSNLLTPQKCMLASLRIQRSRVQFYLMLMYTTQAQAEIHSQLLPEASARFQFRKVYFLGE